MFSSSVILSEGELFGARERKIAHIMMAEVPWLHVNLSQEKVLTNVPRLPVPQRLALELLIQGHSRKDDRQRNADFDQHGLGVHPRYLPVL